MHHADARRRDRPRPTRQCALLGRADRSGLVQAHQRRLRPPDRRRSAQDLRHHGVRQPDRKSTRLNSSHGYISYAVFCLKKKKKKKINFNIKKKKTKKKTANK